MQYTPEEIRQYAAEEDVKFIRMAFCDVEGRQKNIAIMPGELDRAFRYGIAIDGSAIPGFGGEVHSDLLLYPDPSTLCVLPWRPEHGRVVRMFCAVTRPDGYGDRGGRPQSFEKGRGGCGGGGFDLYLRHGNGILPVLPG